MQVEDALLLEVEAYVTNFISEQVPSEFAYHNIEHTINVVHACREIGRLVQISEQEQTILELAAWFHDTGYDKGPQDHEERSCKYARAYLAKQDFDEIALQTIEACIMATKLPQTPTSLLQQIICDADLSHLGLKNYWDRCGRVRQELTVTKGVMMSEQEWIDFELGFITSQQYKTEVAKALYNKRKNKHIRQLRKQKLRLNPHEALTMGEVAKLDKKKNGNKRKKKRGSGPINELNLGRGVETMYRTTYRTHVNLSSIADNKANIMLSINAIIVSIIISTLVPRFGDNPKLIIPTLVLLSVCLLAVVFATLSTRPKITEGKFSRKDIEEKKSNLLFFGNFYNMDLQDYQWGMMEMIKDQNFLYSSMTRDLYFLGVVLAKKYRYLSYCYSIFMYGLIFSVIVFAISFIWK